MAKKAVSPRQTRTEIVSEWQRHRGHSNESMAAMLGISAAQYGRNLKAGFSNCSIERLISVVDYLKIPPEEAAVVLSAGSAWLAGQKLPERVLHAYRL